MHTQIPSGRSPLTATRGLRKAAMAGSLLALLAGGIAVLPRAAQAHEPARAVHAVGFAGHGAGFYRTDWHGGGGYWNHGWHGGHYGWWYINAGVWSPYPYYYPYPYAYRYADPYYLYPAPNYAVPEPPPSGANLPPQAANWYYCDASKAYYPYVQDCSSGWRLVAAAPSPGPSAPPPPR